MVTRDDVKKEVIHLLHTVSSIPEGKIDENSNLADDLFLTSIMRRALAVSYTAISKKLGGKRIVISEAAQCETAGEVIELILSKINFPAPRGGVLITRVFNR